MLEKIYTFAVMKKDLFKYQFWGIAAILLFFFMLYALYRVDKYIREQNTVPMTEEEKELIEFENPKGVPTRYW